MTRLTGFMLSRHSGDGAVRVLALWRRGIVVWSSVVWWHGPRLPVHRGAG